MPGAGKSTVGRMLAASAGMAFVDTDDLLAERLGSSLQAFLDERGYQALREEEALTLMGIECEDTVISTGGSAIYSSRAMQHLNASGDVVFLDISFAEMERRITNLSSRGIAKPVSQSIHDMFNERRELYFQHCTYHINGDALSAEQICKVIAGRSLSGHT